MTRVRDFRLDNLVLNLDQITLKKRQRRILKSEVRSMNLSGVDKAQAKRLSIILRQNTRFWHFSRTSTSKGSGSEVHLDEDIQDILEYLYDSGSEIDDEVKDPDYKNSASDELEFEEEEREEIPAKRPRLEVAPVRMLTTCRDTSTAAAGSNVAAGTWRKDDPSPPNSSPFHQNIFKSIKEETNRYARSIIDRESKKGPLKPHGMLAKWKAVSVAQIKFFFCVIIHMSLVKKPGMKDYWSTHGFLKNAFCQSINMPRTLFMRILSMLHLNDNSKYIEYGKPGHDRLFKIRPVLESLIYSFGNAYTPQQNLTIDEAMCPFRGRVGFRVYIKGKPHKYGINIFQICEAVSGYAYNLDIYTGKDPEQPEHNSIPNLVDRLAKRFYGQGYHIYFDRWFSSPELFDKLWEKKTLAVGTVMPSRKTMPKTEFSQKLKRGEIIKMRRKHLLAIKWKDVRDVFMLSTVHEGKMMPVKPKTPTREELFKPDAVIDYNKGKWLLVVALMVLAGCTTMVYGAPKGKGGGGGGKGGGGGGKGGGGGGKGGHKG
ncbi:PGBD5 [Cordylochernes scorpioides]|uniref:PGBD5 n=1 Tax=Cordylochernes scorpioides TaxID=51811 RepID=A0ABY6KZ02_9ARAC|nr:PGBD5 [Cordylochernes scorpioides]